MLYTYNKYKDILKVDNFELRETHPGAKIRDLSCTYDMVGYRYLSKVLWRKMDIKYVKQYKIEGEKTFVFSVLVVLEVCAVLVRIKYTRI